MTIAETMKEVLIENEMESVQYGDIGILDECAYRCTHTNLNQLPSKQRHIRILNALDKSDLFNKYIIDTENSLINSRKSGVCRTRLFYLKEFDKK